jgi:hypothetical protein
MYFSSSFEAFEEFSNIDTSCRQARTRRLKQGRFQASQSTHNTIQQEASQFQHFRIHKG